MRTIRAWSLAATFVIGFSMTAAWADDDTGTSTPKPSLRAPTWQWKPFEGWFGSKNNYDARMPVESKPAPKAEKTTAKKPNPPVKRASIVADAAAERSQQEAALLRRLQACDRLKEIAIRTNDPNLLHRAEELEERSQACYRQRTARLQGLAGSFESDEKTLDQYLGTGTKRSAVDAPHTVSSDAAGSRAAMKEVLP